MNNKTEYKLLLLGGTSAIGMAWVRQRLSTLKKQGCAVSIILVGRQIKKLQDEADDLKIREANVIILQCDLANPASCLSNTPELDQNIDEVMLAYGSLTEQSKAQMSCEYLQSELTTNIISPLIWLEHFARIFERQGSGKLVVLGSVAGDRGRQSNYAYGTAKSALATFIQGMQHRFAAQKNISITLIKPGFVDSPMTAHIQPKGMLWAKPQKIAQDAEYATQKAKRVKYTPWFWSFIMAIIRNVPAAIFHKTKL